MYQIDFRHPVHVYFVGIGGISMSGLAEVLADAGFRISGSDAAHSALTENLEAKGICVHYGQRRENITADIDVAVFTGAIRSDNPEYLAVQEMGIPSLSRAQLLGQIMKNYPTSIAVSGTHGKTTTTSMAAEILLQADSDPTLSIGGILKSIGGNIRLGGSDLFVTEACEYTNSFLSLFPKIGIILNIEADHLDFFKDLADIRSSFRRFAQLIPADGVLIINGEIPGCGEITEGLPCRVVTFGHSEAFDYHPENIRYDDHACASFRLCTSPSACTSSSACTSPSACGQVNSDTLVTLSVPGEHNVLNALAALALSDLLSIDRTVASRALQSFSGTDRRFEYKGQVGGVTIIDDYAHHPTEITATLKAAQNYPHKTLWCVFQPHTYSRTEAFLHEFAQALSLADKVVLADIYAAREQKADHAGITSETLQQEIRNLGQECFYFPTFDEIENFLLQNCINGDLLITMGAGDIVKIGENLLGN